MTTETFNVGDGHVSRIAFYDLSNAEADPTAISFRLTKPDGSTIAYSYGDPELIRDSLGNYHVDIVYDQKGRHIIKWTGTGAVPLVEELEIYVMGTS